VAAGHTLTAEAGAEVLREGGNAVDACIAAAFMSWVTESTLTSPGGGGFLLVRAASTGKVRLHDFFVAIPGHGVERPVREMDLVDVEFDRGTSQIFRVGGASCAVPGAIAGLEAAHRAYARLPWRRLLEPAIAVARDGHELVPAQAYLHGILDLILRRTEIGHEIFGPGGVPLVAGDRLVMPDLAATLEQLAESGAEAFYAGELGRRVCEHVREEGGSLTEEDLAAYRVITRKPIRTSFGARAFVSNPPPSSGGTLIAYALLLFSRLGPGGPPGSAEAIARLAEVMREQTLARGGSFVGDLYRGGLPKRLFAGADEAAERIAARDLESGLASTEESVGAPGTTHISVVDAASGEDLTAVTLTQIILENERNHRGGLPIGFLHQLIKHGEAWQDFLQRSMKSSLEGIVSNQREMERVFQEWMSRAGWGTMVPGAGLGARAEAKRDGGEPDPERLREEVSALRERLKSLEERLEKRKAQPQ